MSHFLSPLLSRSPRPARLRNRRNGRILANELETAFDSTSRRRGLLGRGGLPDGAALVIAPCGAVHTFFMRFPIDLVFASRDGHVVKTRSTVPPGRVSGTLRAFAVIELPAGVIERSGTRSGDTLEITALEAHVWPTVPSDLLPTRRAWTGFLPARQGPLAILLNSKGFLSIGRLAVCGHGACSSLIQ